MIAGSNTGEYVSIGVISGTTATNDIVVAVWYDQTERVLKYAYRTVAPAGDTVHENRWDFMIIPALGTGHYALKENKVSIESSNNWSEDKNTILQNQLTGAKQITRQLLLQRQLNLYLHTKHQMHTRLHT